MRTLEEIYDETRKKCLEENCQSMRSIALEAMEKAIKEFRREIQELIDNTFM